MSPAKIGKEGARGKVWKVAFFLALWLGAVGIWFALDDAGMISHDEMTIVYNPSWQVGEYKTCTTINGNGGDAPQQSRGPQNILCDGGVPSGRSEDGRTFKVRFHGKTYVDTKNVRAFLVWNCRKNAPDTDPVITCEQDKSDPAPPTDRH